MNKELIIRKEDDAVDFALLKDGKLIELHMECLQVLEHHQEQLM
jgi:hypothetical protein